MNQLTREEKEFVEESRSTAIGWKKQLADNCMEAPSSDRSLRLISIINRLSARCESFWDIEKREMILMASVVELEEWKRNSSHDLVKAGMKIGALQSNLSALMDAVEPFLKDSELLLPHNHCQLQRQGCDEDDWEPILISVCPRDLRRLSTVAAGIKK